LAALMFRFLIIAGVRLARPCGLAWPGKDPMTAVIQSAVLAVAGPVLSDPDKCET
jgi:hypothetical protein